MSAANKNNRGQRSTASSRSKSSSQRSSADRVAAVKQARNSSGTSSSAKRSTGTNRRRKRRRQSPDFAKILLIIIGIIIAILCVAVGLKGCSKDEGEKSKETPAATEVPETEIHAEITVNGISINGLTKSEAMDKILADLGWDMRVSYNGESKEVENLMVNCVDQVLEEALGKGDAGTYTVTADGVEESIAAAVETIASGWDVQPKNGSINSYDKASGEFKFTGGQNGIVIDRDKLSADLLNAVKSGDYDAVIEAAANQVAPEITEAQAKASFKRLGTYTTTTTNNKARNENVRIASEAINGMIIQPGEEFSFNLTTGNRTAQKGYQPAGAYVNGVLVEEPGGGVCQVSSTLYNAVVFSGLKTTERHAHSYEPSYVTPGEDAMVSYDGYSGPDMKFVNNSKTAVGIKTSFANQKLTVSIYGNPILEEGVTLSMVSTKVKELDPPAPVYEEDQTLQPGVEVEAKAATMGSRWVTNLVTKKDGVVINEMLLHNSTYKGKSATIKRNTSGVVIPVPGETSTEAGSSAAESEGTMAPVGPSADGPGAVTTTEAPTEAPQATEATQATEAPAPSTQPTGSVQNAAPGEVIVPSTAASGSTSGPGDSVAPTAAPQSPADITPGSGSPATALPQSSPSTGGPGTQTAQPGANPGNVGLIAPIG